MRNEREISLSDIPLPATELLERQIIADAVENPDIIGEVASVIFPDYFSSDDRKMIWTTIVDMYNARETIDMASVWQRTGKAYIEEIQTKGVYASTRTGFLDHAGLLRVANTKKRAYYAAITIAQQSASVGTSEEDIFAAAESLSQKIKADGGSIGESRLLDVLTDVANETEAEQKEAMQGRSVRVPTGFPSLDRYLWGGWGRGQLVILAARPSVGKTAVMLQTAAADGLQTIDVGITVPTVAAISQTNLLGGSERQKWIPDDGGGTKYYKLTYNQSGTDIGWYWGEDGGASFYSAANKAWLALPPASSSAQSFLGLPDFDEPTGIQTPSDSPLMGRGADGAWYTITGVKLDGKPAAKGIYIHNGRKEVLR